MVLRISHPVEDGTQFEEGQHTRTWGHPKSGASIFLNPGGTTRERAANYRKELRTLWVRNINRTNTLTQNSVEWRCEKSSISVHIQSGTEWFRKGPKLVPSSLALKWKQSGKIWRRWCARRRKKELGTKNKCGNHMVVAHDTRLTWHSAHFQALTMAKTVRLVSFCKCHFSFAGMVIT